MIWPIMRALRLIATAAAIMGAFWAGWTVQGYRAAEKASALVAAQQAAQIAQTKRMIRNVDALAQEYQDKIAVLVDNHNRLAAVTGGLRKVIAARAAGDNPIGPSPADGAPVWRAFGECVDRYSELAGIADGYASQLIALQAWARLVQGK